MRAATVVAAILDAKSMAHGGSLLSAIKPLDEATDR
jgi:hypothetical protein